MWPKYNAVQNSYTFLCATKICRLWKFERESRWRKEKKEELFEWSLVVELCMINYIRVDNGGCATVSVTVYTQAKFIVFSIF